MSKQQQQQQQHRNGSGNRHGNGRHYQHGMRQFGQSSHDYSHGFDDREELELKKLWDDGADCEKLFKDLSDKMNSRFKKCVKLEAELRRRYSELKAEAKVLAEEKKIVTLWKKEAADLQTKSEEDLNEIRKERLQLERAGTDIAVQLAELKRTQREMEKNADKRGAGPQQMQVENLQMQTHQAGQSVDDIPLAKRMKISKPELKRKENMSAFQAALHEDAPGLFELLEERGLLEDMDIITNVWSEDPENQSCQTEDFKDLANIIGKHWGPSTQLLSKDPRSRVQIANASKPNYCLPCLVSLLDQAKFLKQRKWPVKWGWCRPLNAFLFVFEKHNRIVVERPEYGFATYFFELVQSVPVKWQVDRLIKVMSCVCNVRAALLENRPLETSILLPEEAAVLTDYGWTPNTGIGSLLNFCDRVHHDYKVEDETGEWKSKIGKLLMDGHDHGSIVGDLPRKLIAQNQNQLQLCTVVKQEADDSIGLGIISKVKEELNYY